MQERADSTHQAGGTTTTAGLARRLQILLARALVLAAACLPGLPAEAGQGQLDRVLASGQLRVWIWPDIAITTRSNRRIATWADIDRPGVVVAVAMGTLHEPVVRERLKQAQLRVLDSPQAREQEVLSGRADVFMTDDPFSRRLLDSADWARLVSPPENQWLRYDGMLLSSSGPQDLPWAAGQSVDVTRRLAQQEFGRFEQTLADGRAVRPAYWALSAYTALITVNPYRASQPGLPAFDRARARAGDRAFPSPLRPRHAGAGGLPPDAATPASRRRLAGRTRQPPHRRQPVHGVGHGQRGARRTGPGAPLRRRDPRHHRTQARRSHRARIAAAAAGPGDPLTGLYNRRYGGEEFVIVMPGMGATAALARAELWRAQLAGQTSRVDGDQIRCTLSAGVAAFPEQADAADKLLKCADSALYRAKREGRDRVYPFRPGDTSAERSARRGLAA